MSHVGFVSAAYWGDVMPFVPIADELAARGHDVSFVVPEGFHDVLADHDFRLVHLGTDFSPRELAAHGQIMERADTIRGMRAATELWIKQLTIDRAPEILTVLDAVAPDVWVSHNTLAWLVELQYDEEINELRAKRGLPPERANVGFGSWHLGGKQRPRRLRARRGRHRGDRRTSAAARWQQAQPHSPRGPRRRLDLRPASRRAGALQGRGPRRGARHDRSGPTCRYPAGGHAAGLRPDRTRGSHRRARCRCRPALETPQPTTACRRTPQRPRARGGPTCPKDHRASSRRRRSSNCGRRDRNRGPRRLMGPAGSRRFQAAVRVAFVQAVWTVSSIGAAFSSVVKTGHRRWK